MDLQLTANVLAHSDGVPFASCLNSDCRKGAWGTSGCYSATVAFWLVKSEKGLVNY